MNIGEKIKSLRLKKQLTQDDVAQITGTTKQAIYKYETGIVTNIPLDKIEKMADLFGVAPSYLMGWEEEKPPVNELSEDERRLIEIYRKISPEAGEMLLTMVNIFEEMPQDRAQMLLAMIRAGIENQG